MENKDYPTAEEQLQIETYAWNEAMEEYEESDGKSEEARKVLKTIEDYNFLMRKLIKGETKYHPGWVKDQSK